MTTDNSVVSANKANCQAMQVCDLVSALRGVPTHEFNPQTIQKMLSGVCVQDASLAPYLTWRPQVYTRNLIYRNDLFELLAVCWESGSASAIHDHAGQDCWLYVHTGSLCIDAFDLVDSSHCHKVGDNIGVRRRERIGKLSEGVIDHRGPKDDIHRVFNRRSFGAPAVSLHVYARPIDVCVVYEPARGLAMHRAMRYDTIEGRPNS